jgi:hypothetical protein
MRKAMWPLVVALGLLLAFGAISGTPQTAYAGIQGEDCDADDDGDDDETCPSVWWYLSINDFDEGVDDDCDDDDHLVSMLEEDLDVVDTDDVIQLDADGGEVWICLELNNEDDDGASADYDQVNFDSDDYGTWEDTRCADQDGDESFDADEDDVCEDTEGIGTDQMSILCNTPDEDSDCQADGDDGDVAALFVCEEDPGVATITISHDVDQDQGDDPDLVEFLIICSGQPDDAEIEAIPESVEIVPALGNIQYSLIILTLLDENGDPAVAEGTEITWTTDNCEISLIETEDDEDPLDGDLFNDAKDVFEEFADFPHPGSADDVYDFVDLLVEDFDDTIEAEAFDEDPPDGDTVSAVILNCGQESGAEPGVAEVCAIVEVEDGADLTFCVEVTVVGPPATMVVTANQTSVRCGESVQITADIKDSEGHVVSEHTLVEVTTNFGGVLGGTGAVVGGFGLVSPLSSTVAETFNGKAVFHLITSETQPGPYTVIVTTGGGGSVAGGDFLDDGDEEPDSTLGGLFSTPVINQTVSVSCTVPAAAAAPAATVRAPSTGQGITPPSTGDAGLADASNGSSWALFVIAGAAAFALAGVASLKFARR